MLLASKSRERTTTLPNSVAVLCSLFLFDCDLGCCARALYLRPLLQQYSLTTPTMSLAKLTSVSTKTLSLLLERQRLQTLPPFSSPQEQPPKTNTLHLAQIKRNLSQLRTGILDLEAKEGPSEAVGLLRNQYDRMRDMLGDVHVSRSVDYF